MNDALLQLTHRAILADRGALRTLIDRYQGLTYALSFRHTHSFPQAQRVARAAWPLVAQKLPSLSEPERLLDLLEASVEKAMHLVPHQPDDAETLEGNGHSVLRTEKVLARRALRLALVRCPLPEAAVFFLRFVEGLTVDEIAELYGVEPAAVVSSLRVVGVDLAFRAGFVTKDTTPPDLEKLPSARREALGFSVVLAESGVAPDDRERIERFVQTDADARREDEGVRSLLELAARTFSAHRLPPDFVKDVLMQVPYTEPLRLVALPRPAPAQIQPVSPSARTSFRSQAPPGDAGVSIVLTLAGSIVGLVGLAWVWERLTLSRWANLVALTKAGQEAEIGLWILVHGLGIVALCAARPPLFSKVQRVPPYFHPLFGLGLGGLVALLWLALSTHASSSVVGWLLLSCAAPLWTVYACVLYALRSRLAILDLEKRLELRLRHAEDSLPTFPKTTALPVAEPPPIPGATQRPSPVGEPPQATATGR